MNYWSSERRLLEYLNHWIASSNFVSKQAILFTSSFPDFIIAACIVALWFSKGFKDGAHFRVRYKILLMFFAFIPTYILAKINQSIFHRPRPIVSIPLELTQDLRSWNSTETDFTHLGSFPSNHAALFFIFNTIAFTINRRLGFASLIFTIYCSIFRIGTGYQWPSDILGGALLGLFVTLLLLLTESWLRNILIWLILQFKYRPTLSYTIGFLFLGDFAQDFQQLRLITSQLFRTRLFH